MKICIVNASRPGKAYGNDSYIDFKDYSTYEDGKWRSWHSISACLGTEFFADGPHGLDHRIYEYDGIILLVNQNTLGLVPFVQKLKKMGKIVCVGYHEGYNDFVLATQNPFWLMNLKELVNEADAYWNVIPSASNVFMSLFRKPILNVIHGAPIDEWDHKLTKPLEEREGILVATRTLDQRLGRHTFTALAVADLTAHMLDTHVTYMSGEGTPKLCTEILDKTQVVQGPRPYIDWLDLISKHKVVFHMDESHTLGQVVMDAALVGVPCIGGNSENNVEAQTASHLRNVEQRLVRYYNEPEVYPPFVEKMKFSYLKRHVLGSFKALVKQLDA